MFYSIDRIEGQIAICYDQSQNKVEIPLKNINGTPKEGDILTPTNNDNYVIDPDQTAKIREENSNKLSRLTANSRRTKLVKFLEKSTTPISATALAEQFKVTRQIVVGDVALLRASNVPIIATPRGYIIEKHMQENIYTIACRHSPEKLLTELFIIVDNGATVVDIAVEHPVYGEIKGSLQISSRFDAEEFIKKLVSNEATPLSALTGGIHLHRILCPSEDCYNRIITALKAEDILID